MRHTLPLFFLLLFTTGCLFAQQSKSIRGQVTDKDSKYPIEGANVTVFEGDSIVGAVTDKNGYYRVQVTLGRVSVRVTYVGYKNAEASNILVTAGKETELNFEMEEKIDQIAEVVVTDKKGPGQGDAQNEFATVSARSFDVEQTSRFSGDRDDPARMASNFAGVGAANDARNDIIIRGNSPLGLLWRFEGIDIPNPNHFGGFGSTGGPVSMLNNNTLSRGDFFTSAFPAEYGNAVSGVFDLNLRNGNADKYEFLAEIGFNGIEAAAEGPFDPKNSQASFLIDYRYSTLGFFKLIGVNFGTGSAVPEYQDLTFKINIPTKKAGIFRIFGLGGLDNISLIGNGDTSNTNLNSLYGAPDEDIYSKVQTGVVGFSHTYFFNSRSYYKLILGASNQTQYANIDTLSWTNPSESGQTEKVKLRQNIYNLHILYNNKIDARNTVTTGIIADVYDVNFTDSLLGDSGYIPLKSGKGFSGLLQAYAVWQHKFTERLTLNVGFHAQYYTLSNSFAPEPRVGLKYQVAVNQYVSFGYGLHHEIQPLPTYYNRDTAAGANFAETNLHMGFTRSEHLVVGYDLSFLKDYHLKVEAYYQYLDHVPVESQSSSFSMLNAGADFTTPNNYSLVNKGIGQNYGIEATFEKFFTKGFYFLTTASVFQSTYKGSDGVWRNTAFNGLFVLNGLAGYEYRFGGKKDKTKRHGIAIDTKITGAGGRYYTPLNVEASAIAREEILEDDQAFSQKYPDYFRMDVKISYRLSMKHVTQEFSTDFQNIFNIKNVFDLVYNPQTNSLDKYYQQGIFILPQYKLLF